MISNKISSGEKNYNDFIGNLYDDYKIKLLHIMLPNTSAYVKSYEDKNSADIKIEFDRKPVNNNFFKKTQNKILC